MATRHIRVYEYNGRTQGITAWSKEFGLKYATLYQRLTQLGWDIERALNTQVRAYVYHEALAA